MPVTLAHQVVLGALVRGSNAHKLQSHLSTIISTLSAPELCHTHHSDLQQELVITVNAIIGMRMCIVRDALMVSWYDMTGNCTCTIGMCTFDVLTDPLSQSMAWMCSPALRHCFGCLCLCVPPPAHPSKSRYMRWVRADDDHCDYVCLCHTHHDVCRVFDWLHNFEVI